jgi:integrase
MTISNKKHVPAADSSSALQRLSKSGYSQPAAISDLMDNALEATGATKRGSSIPRNTQEHEKMMTNKKAPVPMMRTARALQSLRDSGYSLPAALAEPIDNSLEANANVIRIRLDDERLPSGKRHVHRIVIADDGSGMDPDILHHYLQIGFGTRYMRTDTIGKYGVGAKLAALNFGTRIDVWSRGSESDPWLHVSFDLVEALKKDEAGEPIEIDPPQPTPIPDYAEAFAEGTGTIVVWSNIDRLTTPWKRRIGWFRNSKTALASALSTSPFSSAKRKPCQQRRPITSLPCSEKLNRGSLPQAYLREMVGRTRKNPEDIRRYLERDVYPQLGTMPMSTVQADHIRDIVFAIRNAGHGQPAVAVRNLIKRLWDYALICGVATVNPAQATPVKFIAVARARSRALSESEISVFLRKLHVAPVRNELKSALRLILLTLTRKSELGLAKWEHINVERGEWEIPAEHSKTGAGQIVYLSQQAVAILERLRPAGRIKGYIFPAVGSDGNTPISQSTLNQALKRVQRGMDHFTVHDLRRTGATRLSELGFQPDWIEKALNHKLRGVRGIYNRAEYAGQRREMLQAWADTLDGLQAAILAA